VPWCTVNPIQPPPEHRGTIPSAQWVSLCNLYQEATSLDAQARELERASRQVRERATQATLIYENALLESLGQLRLPGVS
jgi:hypothetical protein